MHNDGVLQVSCISPLQAADMSAGMLHPQVGFPLSSHTQTWTGLWQNTLMLCKPSSCAAQNPYPQTVHKTCKTPLLLEDRLCVKHKVQQIECVSWDLLSAILT